MRLSRLVKLLGLGAAIYSIVQWSRRQSQAQTASEKHLNPQSQENRDNFMTPGPNKQQSHSVNDSLGHYDIDGVSFEDQHVYVSSNGQAPN